MIAVAMQAATVNSLSGTTISRPNLTLLLNKHHQNSVQF
jgi:hypothetical protein